MSAGESPDYPGVVLAVYAVTADLARAELLAKKALELARRQEALVEVDQWVRAVAVDMARRRRWRRRPAAPATAPQGPGARLHRAVLELPVPQREVVLLTMVADLPAVAVASLVDCPVETVADRLSLAWQALGVTSGDELVGPFGELRDELRAAVRQPDRDPVVPQQAVYNRPALRTRVLSIVGVTAVALLAIAMIPLLRAPLPPEVAAPPTPSGTRTSVDSVSYADDAHGFALRLACPTAPHSTQCGVEVLYTEDGNHWAIQSRLPATSPDHRNRGRIQALGNRKVIVDAAERRWYSTNSGLTWQEVPIEPDGVVVTIPHGAILQSGCVEAGTFCAMGQEILVTLPDTGRTAVLANPPWLDDLTPGRIPAADDGWWVSGRNPETGQWSLAVSRDNGQNWSVSAVPDFAGTPRSGISVAAVTAAPHTLLYATAVGQLTDTPTGLLAVFRSIDGGQTWTRTWQAADGRQPRELVGDPVLTPDGILTVAGRSTGSYTSADGGVTFHPSAGPPRIATWTVVGYIASTRTRSGNYSWSPDGGTWYDFTVG